MLWLLLNEQSWMLTELEVNEKGYFTGLKSRPKFLLQVNYSP